jgi:hypothetical protein
MRHGVYLGYQELRRDEMNEIKSGMEVKVNGNNEAVVIDKHSSGMWNVRLHQSTRTGIRVVGEITVPEASIQPKD